MALSRPIHYGGESHSTMYLYDATLTLTIDAVDQYHAVQGLLEGSDVEGLTYLASSSGAITDTEDNSGTLRCTDVGHGLTTGQYVTLHGMGDAAHAGTTGVTVISADVFDCDDIAYNSIDDTGNWSRGSSLTVDNYHQGVYHIIYSASLLSAANNKNFKVEVCVNTTDQDEYASEEKLTLTTDIQNLGSGGIVHLSVGDVVWLKAKGTTDDTNLIIEHANVALTRV